MNSPPHGFGFKLLMHLLAGSWFAATSLVWICIFVPWQDQLPKGRAIDIPWIVLRATLRCATELVQGEYSAYLPLVLISSIFGSLFLARVLYVHRLHSNLVALVFGGLVSIPVFALLLIWLAARGESQRP